MSLLESAYEDFIVMNKTVVDDGYGGTRNTWSEGITIKGALVYDDGTQMKIAEAMGVTGAYTLTVKKSVLLDYHTVLKRKSNGKIFRLVSDSDDKKTPEGAGLNMRQYLAEEWKLA